MILFSVIFGLFIIGIGVLCERYPNLISGYNTMPKSQKANVDIKATAAVMRRYMIGGGIASIVTPILLHLAGLGEYLLIGLIYPTIIALLIASIKIQRFDHNKRKWLGRNLSTIIIATTSIILGFILFRGMTPSTITFENDTLIIEGSYGTTTPIELIESVTLLEELPKIAVRVNGSDTGSYLRGNFRFKEGEFGTCLLYIKLRSAPYVYVKRAEGKDIIFNTPDSLETCRLYNSLRDRL